ncbi:MAG: GNAT family N-acetyltransferase [Promethearchaeota archaeon]
MVTVEEISELDRIASRSWPAREVQRVGGWLLRATSGVTRRANSVLPLDWEGAEDLGAAVDRVCEFYAQRRIIPRFQVTRGSQPEGLDESLGELGFVVELKVIIQVAPIDALVTRGSEIPVGVNSSPNREWFAAYAEAGGLGDFSLKIRQEIMERVPATKGFAAARVDGRIVGIGFGVSDGEWLGLFAIVTHPEYRRRSVATTVSCALAQWGQRQGARKVYLQVEEENPAALKLYEKMGFRNHHKYWYRMLEDPEDKD